MAGVTPNEAETLIATLLYKRTYHADRDADLMLGLFNNNGGTALSETSVLADVVAVTGTGYAAKTLTDASWTVNNDTAAYAAQVFTGGAGGWSAAYGYYIYTKAAGGTARLLHYEVDASGPRTLAVGDTYTITPSVAVA